MGHKKEPTYFFCNFVKGQRILMQFSLLDLKWTIHVAVWTSPTSPNWCCYTTLWKSKHQKCTWTQLHLLMLTTLTSGHEISRLQHGLLLIMARYTRIINCRPCCNLYIRNGGVTTCWWLFPRRVFNSSTIIIPVCCVILVWHTCARVHELWNVYLRRR